MILTAIDPGLAGCGVATFVNGRLTFAAYTKNTMRTNDLRTRVRGSWTAALCDLGLWSRMVVECPRVYQGTKQKGDPNDLVSLALLVGCFVSQGAETVYPYQWKGQLPKEVCAKRIDLRLDDQEKGYIKWPAKSLRHNVYDAIGIGLHALGRGLV